MQEAGRALCFVVDAFGVGFGFVLVEELVDEGTSVWSVHPSDGMVMSSGL